MASSSSLSRSRSRTPTRTPAVASTAVRKNTSIVQLRMVDNSVVEVDTKGLGTIGDLKKKVAEKRPAFNAELQRIIYDGKFLKDDAQVSEVTRYVPGKYPILLMFRPKPPPRPLPDSKGRPPTTSRSAPLRTTSQLGSRAQRSVPSMQTDIRRQQNVHMENFGNALSALVTGGRPPSEGALDANKGRQQQGSKSQQGAQDFRKSVSANMIRDSHSDAPTPDVPPGPAKSEPIGRAQEAKANQEATTSGTPTSQQVSSATSRRLVSSARQQVHEIRPQTSDPGRGQTLDQPSPSARIIADAQNNLALGDQYEDSVRMMTDMGFSRAQADRAMRLAFNNPDRAIELLLSGAIIVDESMANPAPPAAAGHMPPKTYQAPAHMTKKARPSERPLPPGYVVRPDSAIFPFMNRPSMLKLKRKVAAEGQAALTVGLQELAASDPEAFQAVKREPQTFVDWVNGTSSAPGTPSAAPSHSQVSRREVKTEMSPPGDDVAEMIPPGAAAAAVTGLANVPVVNPNGAAGLQELLPQQRGTQQQQGSDQSQGQATRSEADIDTTIADMESSSFQHPPVVIELSEEDRRAISRIAAMGFPLERVVEAYVVTGHDEALAIELLLNTFHDALHESPYDESSDQHDRRPPGSGNNNSDGGGGGGGAAGSSGNKPDSGGSAAPGGGEKKA